jgi:hypothetical protein
MPKMSQNRVTANLPAMTNQPLYRRIVTGSADNGRSTIVSDDRLPVSDVLGIVDFWQTDAVPASLKDAWQPQASPKLLPAAGGTIFRLFEIPASPKHASNEELIEQAKQAFAAADASDCQVDTSRHPMMHCTETIDYVVLLRGNVTLILDDAEVDLEPFDAVVQRGANHYWVNSSDTPALLLGVLLDAKPA